MSGTTNSFVQSNPLIAQGVLTRLRTSILFPSNSSLNVTPSFLGKAGISIARQGNVTLFIDTLTGGVLSPEPYQKVMVSINLLRTQQLAVSFKQQIETSAIVGDMVVKSDSSTFPDYNFTNCAIEETPEIRQDGNDAGWNVVIGGYYYINNSLWNPA